MILITTLKNVMMEIKPIMMDAVIVVNFNVNLLLFVLIVLMRDVYLVLKDIIWLKAKINVNLFVKMEYMFRKKYVKICSVHHINVKIVNHFVNLIVRLAVLMEQVAMIAKKVIKKLIKFVTLFVGISLLQ